VLIELLKGLRFCFSEVWGEGWELQKSEMKMKGSWIFLEAKRVGFQDLQGRGKEEEVLGGLIWGFVPFDWKQRLPLLS